MPGLAWKGAVVKSLTPALLHRQHGECGRPLQHQTVWSFVLYSFGPFQIILKLRDWAGASQVLACSISTLAHPFVQIEMSTLLFFCSTTTCMKGLNWCGDIYISISTTIKGEFVPPSFIHLFSTVGSNSSDPRIHPSVQIPPSVHPFTQKRKENEKGPQWPQDLKSPATPLLEDSNNHTTMLPELAKARTKVFTLEFSTAGTLTQPVKAQSPRHFSTPRQYLQEGDDLGRLSLPYPTNKGQIKPFSLVLKNQLRSTNQWRWEYYRHLCSCLV